MLRVMVISAMLGLLLIGCKSNPIHKQEKEMETLKIVVATSSERETLFNGFLSRMKSFVETSQDDEIRKVAQFGLDNAALVEPTGEDGAARVINPKHIPAPLLVVPLVSSDEKWEFWKQIFLLPWSASYDSEINAIMIKPQAYNDKWKKGLELHEVFHAHERSLGLIPPNPNRREFIAGELRAHTFHNRVLMSLGGEGYHRWLKQKVRRMVEWHQLRRVRVGETQPPEFAFDPALDMHFGESLSQSDRSSRTSVTYLAVMFGAIDQTVKNEISRANLKATILHNFYKETGNGPSR